MDSRTKYDAWGEITAQQGTGGAVTTPDPDGSYADLLTTDNQDIGFTGYLKDSESGFYYAKARYYDPRIARFTTEDPEEGKAMNPPSLHRYLYAYANPTVYLDPTGKIEWLANGANEISSWNKWLGHLAHELPNNTLGHIVSGGVGIGRGLLGLTEGAVRGVNVVANVGVLASATVGNLAGANTNYADGSAKELQGTVEATQQTYTFLRNGGVEKLYNKSAEVLTRARAGDNEAISDVSAVVASAVAPTRAAGMTVEEAGNAARQIASDAATQARNVAQQTKNAVRGARRIVEDAGGSGADAVPVSPVTPGYNLERRMELIADSDFGPTNQPTAGNSTSVSTAESVPIVVGEDMTRVKAYSRVIGGQTIDDWLAGRKWSQKLNDEFIATAKAQDRKVLDIGPAFGRRLLNRVDPSLGRPASSVYGGERKALLNYKRYLGMYERVGKYEGGVQGFDN